MIISRGTYNWETDEDIHSLDQLENLKLFMLQFIYFKMRGPLQTLQNN